MRKLLKVLIICTGNSCRSIFGEALLNHLGSGRVQAYSAGSHPAGQVHPETLQTLKSHNIPTDGLSSKSWDVLEDKEIDIVISVCDQARGESCPVYMKNVAKAHWGLPDPAHVVGTQEEIRAAFEDTYESLKNRINTMLALPLDQLTDQELAVKLNEIGCVENQ